MVSRRRKGPVYRDRPKKNVPKTLNRAAIAAGLLFFALVIVGFTYTFFADQNTTPPTSNTQPIATVNSAIKPPAKPPSNASVGVSVESFDSLAYIGSQANITVRTNPGAFCKIEVLYNDVDAIDPGLAPKTADDFGTVSWNWTIAPSAPEGLWPVNITCANATHTKSGMVQAKLGITK